MAPTPNPGLTWILSATNFIRTMHVSVAIQNHAFRFTVREFLIAIAAISCIIGGFTNYGLFGASSITLIIGVLLIVHGQRVKRKWATRSGIAVSIPSSCILGLVVARWLLFGIGPIYSAAAYTHELTRMAELADSDFSNVRISGVGSFIDTEHVWRLRLSPNKLDRVIEEYGLVAVPAEDVPQSFRHAFPRWWRPTHSVHSQYFSTPNFPSQSRGPDGIHCFTMYDSQTQDFYVWYKSNF